MPNMIRWGAQIAVNTQTAGDQSKPNMIALADGSFLVVWQTNSTTADGSLGAVKGQRYAASGAPIGGEFLVNTATAGNQLSVRAATLNSGGFVLTWESTDTLQDGSGTAVKAQLFSSAGVKVGGEFLVNTLSFMDQQAPTVAALADGGFVVAWHSTDPAQDGAGWAVKAQRFDSAGVKVGSEFLVNTVAFGSQNDIDVAGLSTGGWVITWQTSSGGSADIFARTFAANGSATGPQFQVSTDYGAETGGRVAALPGGGFVVTWSTGGGGAVGIRGAIYDSNAAKIGAEFAVNTASGNGYKPDITALPGGGFVVSWEILNGIKAQQFSAAGAKVGTEQVVAAPASTSLGDSAVAALGGGGYVVGWDQSPSGGATGFDIRAQRYLPDNTPNSAPDLGAPTLALSRAENATAVMTFAAADDGGPGALSYSITGGVDSSTFYIDSVTGALRFIATPNFEAPTDADHNNVYEVIVGVSDGALSDTQAITITVTNVDDAPVFTSYGGVAQPPVSRVENGTSVATAAAFDPEGATVTYSISGGVDATRFTINTTTGVLAFVTAPNFEAPADSDHNNSYFVQVRASDGTLFSNQYFVVTVTNQNEPVVITSNGGGDTAALTVAENFTGVTTVVGADPELAAIAYSIAGGTDAAKFAINASTGVLTFVSAPDFEAHADSNGDNVYQVIVRASDGVFTDSQTLSVTVANQNEPVVITSNGGGDTAAVTTAENLTSVTTIVGADPELAAIAYSIAGGTDAAKFAINASTGVLTFVSAPDFEAHADSNGDNVYQVIVRASDGVFTDSQTLSVTVANQNEAPVIASDGGGSTATVMLAENETAVATVAAADPEGTTPTYAIAGGADAALFTIDSATGGLSFLAAPDYETPADSNADNVYEVVVTASDGVLADSQALSVTILDLDEGGQFLGGPEVGPEVGIFTPAFVPLTLIDYPA